MLPRYLYTNPDGKAGTLTDINYQCCSAIEESFRTSCFDAGFSFWDSYLQRRPINNGSGYVEHGIGIRLNYVFIMAGPNVDEYFLIFFFL